MQHQVSIIQYIPVTVAKISLGLQNQLFAGDLSALVKFADSEGSPLPIEAITLRDFTRLAFAELGIDIEFSGRNENEKGVIIDIDEERVAQLGLNLDALRFGQTIIRVDPGHTQFNEVELMYSNAELNGQTMYKPEVLIGQLVIAGLQQLKPGDSRTE